MLGGTPSSRRFLNTCKPVLEGVHVAGRSVLPSILRFVSSYVARFILWYGFHCSKVMAK
jgi:hypothetical protein